MSGSKELDVRMRIAKVIQNNPEFTKTDVWNHSKFKIIGIVQNRRSVEVYSPENL